MNNVKRSLAIIAATCLLLTGTSMAFADGQDRDRDQTKDHKQDGSCQEYTGSSQFDQILVQYGNDNGNGNPDADHEQDRDGSCQNYTGSSPFDQLLVKSGNGNGNGNGTGGSNGDKDRDRDGSCLDAV